MLRLTKKTVALSTATLLLIGGGVAYAYWTANGSGTGTGATGTNVAITVVQTSTPTAMAPGDAPQSLNGTFLNPNNGPVYVGTVTASIASVTTAAGAPGGTCDATDYALANPVMTINEEVLANDTSTWTGATIQFSNKSGANQDACKLATVNLAYVIS